MRKLILALFLSLPAFAQDVILYEGRGTPISVAGVKVLNPTANSAGAVTSLAITISSLNLTAIDPASVFCYTGTTTRTPFTAYTFTTSGSAPIATVTISFSSTANITCGVNATGGSGTPGSNGANGSNGTGYAATSTTSLAIGSGSKTFTTQSGLAYSAGARVRATSAANTANYMEGLATSYSGTSLVVNVDTTGGSGTAADWNLNVSGNVGATGPSGGGGSVFFGSSGCASSFSATPTFSLADITGPKSCTRFEPGAMTANVTGVTFSNKSSGAKFSIVWLQDGTGGRTLTHGGSASNTCETDISLAANKYTEQFYEVAADGATVYGVGCSSNDPGKNITALTDGATISWAVGSALNAFSSVTIAGNRTLNVSGLVIGGNYVSRITQDATGSRTLTPGTGCTWKALGGAGSGTFALSTAANTVDHIAFYYDGTTCWATVGKAYAAP